MTVKHLALTPRDGLFCKDGRGWYTSDVGRSRSHLWPLPATLRGALRGAFGRDWMARTGETLEPSAWEAMSRGVEIVRTVALRRPIGESFAPKHRAFPVPADAIHLEREVYRLDPEPPAPGARVGTLGSGDDPAVEALYRPRVPKDKPRPAPAFWGDEEMRAWLLGQPVKRPESDDPARTPRRRVDIHLAIDRASQTAAQTMLHSREVLEPLTRVEAGEGWIEWAIGVEVELPEEAPELERGPLFVGGGRRLVPVEPVAPDIFADPPSFPAEGSKGLRLVLATPAAFRRGSLPDGFERAAIGGAPVYKGELPKVEGEVILRAALIPRPLHASTWDMVKRGPRPTRSLVRPGSVYFFEKSDGGAFTRGELRSLWLGRIGDGREEGLGLVLPGVWSPANKGGS
jgi:CRISPR-associated protein Cmr3